MGVPAFYRWLSEKYPKIVQDVVEERVLSQNGSPLPFDASRPNPSGLECDNLYIDMNGIIHPCAHPEHGPQPKTEADMYANVCAYVDRLVRAMRPRQLLYLAIDGVAPRAKMNQQRARRFRSAQEARELHELEEDIRSEVKDAPPAKKAWDSNVITPGTPFMLKLAECIRFYIRKRLAHDKAWKGLRVMFSDASIPGEGEHKIMTHIRRQRAQPGYNPNQVHILHGLDADLIMLALATHEAHFYISREQVTFGRKSIEAMERRREESGFTRQQEELNIAAGSAMDLPENQGTPLERVSIPILRQYLENEFRSCLQLPFVNLESLIDDFVFMCFFVGNDFLPHLPSLDIRTGGLDYLINVYQRLLPSMGQHLTKSGGHVNLSLVDLVLSEVGAIEDVVFGMKHDQEQAEQERRKRFRNNKKPDMVPQVHAKRGRSAKILERGDQEVVALNSGNKSKGPIKVKHMEIQDNAAAAEALKASLGDGGSNMAKGQPESKVAKHDDKHQQESKSTSTEPEEIDEEKVKPSSPIKQVSGEVGSIEEEFGGDEEEDDDEREDEGPKIEDTIVPVNPQAVKAFKERVKLEQQKKLDEYADKVVDKVRLHESGWKDRYYADKCKADDVEAHGGREHLFRSYVMGLCWVMKYYYDGCPSWKWYYPFHYGPFASDLRNIERFEKDCQKFDLATPFNPVEQLMAVLPSDSAHAIPKASRWLMEDPESPIIDFYPKDVPVDPNGKAMPWLWVVLLPFIEEDRLLAALAPSMKDWTKEELLCNARGLDDGYVYIHRNHPLSKKFATVLAGGKTANSPKVRLADAAQYDCAGFSGSLRPPLSHEVFPVDEDVRIPAPPCSSELTEPRDGCLSEIIEINNAVCLSFSEPLKLSHKSMLLPGARLLAPCLTAEDKRIRRPKLNRGGGSIANMGMASGQSHRSGFGSMNITSFERDLARRTGREGQMNQVGTRAWGAMEPQAKRRRQHSPVPPPVLPNPVLHGQLHRQRYGPGQYQQPHSPGRPPPHGHPPYHQQQHHWTSNQPHHQGYRPPPTYHQQQGRGGYRTPQPYQQRPQDPGPHRSGHQNRPPYQNRPPQGFDFRSHNQQNGGRRQAEQSRTSSAVMNSLRAQLSDTLQRNKKK